MSSGAIAAEISACEAEKGQYESIKMAIKDFIGSIGDASMYFNVAADKLEAGLTFDGKPADEGKCKMFATQELLQLKIELEGIIGEITGEITALEEKISGLQAQYAIALEREKAAKNIVLRMPTGNDEIDTNLKINIAEAKATLTNTAAAKALSAFKNNR